MDSRTGATLTPSQRELLTADDAEVDSSTARSAKARIRERLRAGMIDYDLVLRELGPSQIQQAFELRKAPDPGVYGEEARLENGMAAAIGMIYLAGLERYGTAPDQDRASELIYARFVEERAKKGIRMALNQLGVSTESVDVDIDIELGEEFDELAALETSELAEYSMSELLQAHQAGTIDNEQFMAAMDEKGLTVDEE